MATFSLARARTLSRPRAPDRTRTWTSRAGYVAFWLAALVLLHLFILRCVGPAGPWTGGMERRQRAPGTPQAAGAAAEGTVERRIRTSETFYPRQVFMDAVVMLGVFAAVAALALAVPFPLADKADPSDTTFVPIPE